MKQLATRYPVILFFAATYLVCWLVWIPIAAAAQWAGLQPSGGLLALAGLVAFGPSLVGIWMAWLTGGRPGLRDLWVRLKSWRVGLRWYLFVILAVPVVLLCASAVEVLAGGDLRALSTAPLFNRMPGLPMWLAPLVGFIPYLLGGSLNEEFGWRGFALPQLLKRFSPLTASVILGLGWGLWHLPLLYIPGASTIGAAFPAFIAGVIPVTTLFTFVHLNTRGSLLMAVLLHNMVNISSDGMPTNMLSWATVAVLWVALLVVVGLGWRQWTARPDAGLVDGRGVA